MKRIFLVLMAVTLVLGWGAFGKAAADTVPVTWGGSSTFFAETFTFSPFIANSVLGIAGGGVFHSHDGETVPVEFNIILNGALLSPALDSTTSNSTDSVPVGSLFGPYPLTFTEGTVSGVRFATTDPGQFHAFIGEVPTVITFNTPGVTPPPPPTGVPEPVTLLLLGTGLLGLIGFRARLT